MPDELTKALLLEEAASEGAIAEALFASVTGGVPLVEALVEARAVTSEVLSRYLARTEAPHLRQVVPLTEVMERLPPGLCARLLAIPVRRDAITGTVDVVVADASDLHPGNEISFHLNAPVRLVRASVAAIDEALRRMRMRSLPPVAPPESRPGPGTVPPPTRPDPTSRDDATLYDSRPRATPQSVRGGTLPPPAPALKAGMPAHLALDALASHALRPSRVPTHDRQAHVVPAVPAGQRSTRNTPPWGTPVHSGAPASVPSVPSEPPTSAVASDIPIPLTRRTFAAVTGGTQKPPPLVNPAESPLGEGYAVDEGHFREIVEVHETAHARGRTERVKAPANPNQAPPVNSFIPGPPQLPITGVFAAFAPQILADIGGILAALRAAGSRDEVLELVLTGARMVALKVALFVVKRGGYLGWACTPEFGDRAAVQGILVPLDAGSVLDEAVRDGIYLGPIRHDEAHASLLQVMRSASRDVAIVPIRVSGKTAVVLVADELGDTMLGTRRLEELARGAGEAFARIVRMRR